MSEFSLGSMSRCVHKFSSHRFHVIGDTFDFFSVSASMFSNFHHTHFFQFLRGPCLFMVISFSWDWGIQFSRRACVSLCYRCKLKNE